MIGDREFREVLDECLARLCRGDDVRSCLETYPQHAERLEPYLRAASTLRGMEVPGPSAGAQQAARQRLLATVAAGASSSPTFGLAWLPAPLMRMGTVALALLLFLIASVGVSAFFGGGDFVDGVLTSLHIPNPIADDGGDDEAGPEVMEFSGRVISVGQSGLALRTDDDVLIFWYSQDTEFEGPDGEPISRDDVVRGANAFVRALPQEDSDHFDALLVRIQEDGQVVEPTPTPEPEPTATPKATATPKPTATPEPEEPEPTATPKPQEPTPKKETPTPAPKQTPPPEETPEPWTEVALEGKITSVSSASFVLKTDGVYRTFKTDAETKVVGFLAPYVYADVLGWQRGDGTFLARKVITYPVEFWATVVSVSSSNVKVKIEGAGSDVTVYKTGDTITEGEPFSGVKVWVKAYKKADGSYQAVWIKVKTTVLYKTVTAINGTTYTLSIDECHYTVKTDGATEFIGQPFVGALVEAKVYMMGDGTYLAYKMIVKVFTGDITSVVGDTISVDVGGNVVEVWIGSPEIIVIGTPGLGDMVEVHVNGFDGSAYSATKVIVVG